MKTKKDKKFDEHIRVDKVEELKMNKQSKAVEYHIEIDKIIEVINIYDDNIDQCKYEHDSDFRKMNKIIEHMRKKISDDDLQDFSNKCSAINKKCRSDGAGLLG